MEMKQIIETVGIAVLQNLVVKTKFGQSTVQDLMTHSIPSLNALYDSLESQLDKYKTKGRRKSIPPIAYSIENQMCLVDAIASFKEQKEKEEKENKLASAEKRNKAAIVADYRAQKENAEFIAALANKTPEELEALERELNT